MCDANGGGIYIHQQRLMVDVTKEEVERIVEYSICNIGLQTQQQHEAVLIELSSVTEPEKMDGIETARDRNAGLHCRPYLHHRVGQSHTNGRVPSPIYIL